MSTKRIQLNNVVQNQLPGYVRSDYPLVAEFLKSYSVPEKLTYDLSEAAKSLNLKIFGENSNSMNLKYDFSWEKMNALVKNGSYFGVTILRIEDVTGENLFAKKKFKKMIKAFKN